MILGRGDRCSTALLAHLRCSSDRTESVVGVIASRENVAPTLIYVYAVIPVYIRTYRYNWLGCGGQYLTYLRRLANDENNETRVPVDNFFCRRQRIKFFISISRADRVRRVPNTYAQSARGSSVTASRTYLINTSHYCDSVSTVTKTFSTRPNFVSKSKSNNDEASRNAAINESRQLPPTTCAIQRE